MEKPARVYAEINLDQVQENLNHIKAGLPEKTEIIAVVKTDGYGHGAIPVAKKVEHLPFIRGFAVATLEEGAALRESGIKKPILMLGYIYPNQYEQMVSYDLEATIFQRHTAEGLSKAAVKLGKTAAVHIKIDTGMNRLGFKPTKENLEKIVYIVRECPGIKLTGIATHYISADENDKERAKQQFAQFKSFLDELKQCGIEIPCRHCANSAGIIDGLDGGFEAVRAGISMYGIYPSDEVNKQRIKLKPALSLISQAVYIKEIEAGESVSYGAMYVADSKRKVATIPIGYGDGYPRSLTNKGYVLIHGKKAPVLGRICMDQFMVDVTHIDGIQEGDKVTLIGTDGGASLPIEELSELSGRFPYEFMCDLGKRIPRIYEGEPE